MNIILNLIRFQIILRGYVCSLIAVKKLFLNFPPEKSFSLATLNNFHNKSFAMSTCCFREVEMRKLLLNVFVTDGESLFVASFNCRLLRAQSTENCRRYIQTQSFQKRNSSFQQLNRDSLASMLAFHAETKSVQVMIDLKMIEDIEKLRSER